MFTTVQFSESYFTENAREYKQIYGFTYPVYYVFYYGCYSKTGSRVCSSPEIYLYRIS